MSNLPLVESVPGMPATAEAAHTLPDEIMGRVGQMTRTLHDSLRGLGLDKLLEKSAHDIPDARDRLDYVAKMSENAAQRVLNATDVAMPLQGEIETGAKALASQWQAAMDAPFSEDQYRMISAQTMQFLSATQEQASATKAQLLDIMMAQDFQDLTGQVIKKVTELAQNLEVQLVQMLIDFSPADIKRDAGEGLLNGPQINPNASNVVADQEQVDDLLDSLGF